MANLRIPRRFDMPKMPYDEVNSDALMMLERERAYLQRMRLEEIEQMRRAVMPSVAWDPTWPLDTVDLSGAPRTEPDRKAIPRLGVALVDEDEGEHALAKEAEALLGYNVLRRKLKIPGKLGEVLACLDIEPLNFEAVEKYKAGMVLWRKKEIISRFDPGYGLTHHIEVLWLRSALGNCKEEVPLFALRKAVQVKKACPEAILEVDELIEEKKVIDPFLVARLDDEVYYLEVWKEPKFEETL